MENKNGICILRINSLSILFFLFNIQAMGEFYSPYFSLYKKIACTPDLKIITDFFRLLCHHIKIDITTHTI